MGLKVANEIRKSKSNSILFRIHLMVGTITMKDEAHPERKWRNNMGLE